MLKKRKNHVSTKKSAHWDEEIEVIAKRKKLHHTGVFVNLVVPKVDRSLLDSRNLICKIMDMKYNVFYVDTQHGILKFWFPATDLQPTLIKNFPKKLVSRILR